MSEVTIIGIDVAKRVFLLHGVSDDGSVVFRKKLSRGQLLTFLGQQPSCVVAMEACATSHHWGRVGAVRRMRTIVSVCPNPRGVRPQGGRATR